MLLPIHTAAAIAAALGASAAIALAAELPPSSPAKSAQLSNGTFQLPANSHWREERIMAAPRFKLSVELGGNKTVKGTMSMLSRQLVDIDVLTEKDIRLKFVQSNSISDIDFGDNHSRETSDHPLDGKTVLAERGSEGRWAARFEGSRRPTAKENSALHDLTYLWAEGIYPDREIEIGESWKVDAKEFKNLFGSNFERPAGEFEFKLARLVEHQGQTCAKITGKGKLTSQTKSLAGSTQPGANESPLDAEMDLSIEIYRSLQWEMDLSVTMKGTLKLSNERDAEALRYTATSPVEFTRTFKKH